METLDLIEACARAAIHAGLAKPGDKIGITAGLPAGRSGGTNLFKVHTRRVGAVHRRRSARQLVGACRRSRNARAFSTLPQLSMLHQRPERFFERS